VTDLLQPPSRIEPAQPWRRLIDEDQAEVLENVVDWFHRLYVELGPVGSTWRDTRWLGTHVAKCPLDLWVYQEMLQELRPDLIVETGTAWGGSALYLASMCDLLGKGEVLTVDLVDLPDRPAHPRIEYLHGSSTEATVVGKVAARAAGKEQVMVVLDSDHRAHHVRKELELYSRFVTVGSYLVVEDTHVNGHPLIDNHGPGPYEAVEEFLRDRSDFVVDRSREKFLLTFNPCGFLRRVA
jgi:cephalosporin hydroxylase